MNEEKILGIINVVGIVATCIGAICGGYAKFGKVKYEVKKEVEKQMDERGDTKYTYERAEKKARK